MAMTQSESQALEVLRWLVRVSPAPAADAVRQTLRVWPLLNLGEKVTYFHNNRRVCERACPALRNREELELAERALEAQSRLFIDNEAVCA